MVIFRRTRRHLRRHRIRRRHTGSAEDSRLFAKEFPKEFKKIRFGTAEASRQWQSALESIGAPKRDVGVQVGIGLKPISQLGTERLVHSALSYAIASKRKTLTLVHKGNIMKFTEGAFRDWGYEVAKNFFGAWRSTPAHGADSRRKTGAGLMIKDAIRGTSRSSGPLTRPEEFDVIATPN